MQELIGNIRYVVYTSGDGYCVLKTKLPEGGQATVSGYNLPTQIGVDCLFKGEYKEHPKYGKTFNAVSGEIIIAGDDKDAVIAYLASGVFKGIGKTMAERIYAAFGEKTMDVLRDSPKDLGKVKGVSKKKIAAIVEALEESRFLQSLLTYLKPFGVADTTVYTLAKNMGKDAEKKIRNNPYIMTKYAHMGFHECDVIAQKMGIEKKSTCRFNAIFSHVLHAHQESEGNTGMELQQFGKECVSLSGNLSLKDVETEVVSRLQGDKYLHSLKLSIDGEAVKQYIFSDYLFTKEKESANILCELNNCKPLKLKKGMSIDDEIDKLEASKKVLLDDLQREAVKTGLSKSLMVITGGAGTGKTTIMDFIATITENCSTQKVLLLAPTGRAARKLSEYTGRPAKTINSFLNIYGAEETPEEVEPVINTTIIVDEMSMVGSVLMWSLLQAIGEKSRLILVGDIDQLPSVSCGAVLRDIIDSEAVPVIRLTKIFRTNAQSSLFANIDRINKGISDLTPSADFVMHHVDDMATASVEMLKLYKAEVGRYGVHNVMLLLPYRKTAYGTIEVNNALQQIVNPPALDKREVQIGQQIFREGDYIMHVLHNTPEASNGDLGFISKIDVSEKSFAIHAKINGNDVVYSRDNINELSLAYAMTIHKSQGSEAKSVICCITKYYTPMLFRNMPYVASSRAREKFTILYDEGLFTAIQTMKSNKRVTLLGNFLKYYSGQFVQA